MVRERGNIQERLAHFTPAQRLALEIVNATQHNLSVVLGQENAMDLVEGVPEPHLSLGVIVFATETAVGMTDFGFRLEDADLIPLATPSDKWKSLQAAAVERILQIKEVETAIIEPLATLSWSNQSENARLKIGKKFDNDPIEFWCCELAGRATRDRVETAWRKQVSLGIIQADDADGSGNCWRLNPLFTDAFRNGTKKWELNDEWALGGILKLLARASENQPLQVR